MDATETLKISFLILIGTSLATAADCDEPGPVINSYRISDGVVLSEGSSIEYTCYSGYINIYGDLTRNCTNGTFTGKPPICKLVCGTPRDYWGSNKTIRGTYPGAETLYKCKSDNAIEATATCDEYGQWEYFDTFPCYDTLNLALGKPYEPASDTRIAILLDGDMNTTTDLGYSNLTSFSIDIAEENEFYDIKNVVVFFDEYPELHLTKLKVCLNRKFKHATLNRICVETDKPGGVVADFILDVPFDGQLANQIEIIAIMEPGSLGKFGADEVSVYGRKRIHDCGEPLFIYGAEVTIDVIDYPPIGHYKCRDGFYQNKQFDLSFCDPFFEWVSRPQQISCTDEPVLPLDEALTPKQLLDRDDSTCITLNTGTAKGSMIAFKDSQYVEIDEVHITINNGETFERVSVYRELDGSYTPCDRVSTFNIHQTINIFNCNYQKAGGIVFSRADPVGTISICEFRVTGRKFDTALECFRMDDASDYKGNINRSLSGKICLPWAGQTTHEAPENYCRSFIYPKPWCFVDSYATWEHCPVVKCENFCKLRSDGFDYKGQQSFTVSGHKCRNWNISESNYGQVPAELSFPDGDRNHWFCRNPGNSHSGPWCYIEGTTDDFELCPIPNCPDGLFELNLMNCSGLQPMVLQTAYYHDSTEDDIQFVYNLVLDYDYTQHYCQQSVQYLIYGYSSSHYPQWIQIHISCVAEDLIPSQVNTSYCMTTSSISSEITSTLIATTPLPVMASTTLENTPSYDLTSTLDTSTELPDFSPTLDVSTTFVSDFLTIALCSTTSTSDYPTPSTLTDVTSTVSESHPTPLYVTTSSSDVISTPLYVTSSISDLTTPFQVTSSVSVVTSTPLYVTASVSDVTTPLQVTSTVSDVTSTSLHVTSPVSDVTSIQIHATSPATQSNATSNNCSCRCYMKSDWNISQEVLEERIESLTRPLIVETDTLSANVRKYISVEDPRPSATYVGSAAIFIFTMTFVFIVLPDIINVVYFLKKSTVTTKRNIILLE